MKCLACQRELSKKETLYDENHDPFCSNAAICNDEHPNSVKNILARQGAATLYTEKELEVNEYENLNLPEDVKDQVLKMVKRPTTVRISDVSLAVHLVQLKDNYGLSSISEAIRFCVQKDFEFGDDRERLIREKHEAKELQKQIDESLNQEHSEQEQPRDKLVAEPKQEQQEIDFNSLEF
jgi:hypothetical protein